MQAVSGTSGPAQALIHSAGTATGHSACHVQVGRTCTKLKRGRMVNRPVSLLATRTLTAVCQRQDTIEGGVWRGKGGWIS